VLRVGINLDKDGFIVKFLGDLFENRSHLATRTTRIGIKVHDDRQASFASVLFQQAIKFCIQQVLV
jgi:hypothetical protein